MHQTFETPQTRLTVSAFLAAALIATTLLTAGLAALYSARPVDPAALLSAEQTPLIVTATRLKVGTINISGQTLGTPSASPGCDSIVC